MRFLLDQNQAPSLVGHLEGAGHDAVHTRDVGLSQALDVDVLAYSKRESRVLVSADTDFGELLARSGDDAPSVLLLRRHDRRRVAELAGLILVNLDEITTDLETGALIVFDGDRIRIRSLPI